MILLLNFTLGSKEFFDLRISKQKNKQTQKQKYSLSDSDSQFYNVFLFYCTKYINLADYFQSFKEDIFLKATVVHFRKNIN